MNDALALLIEEIVEEADHANAYAESVGEGHPNDYPFLFNFADIDVLRLYLANNNCATWG